MQEQQQHKVPHHLLLDLHHQLAVGLEEPKEYLTLVTVAQAEVVQTITTLELEQQVKEITVLVVRVLVQAVAVVARVLLELHQQAALVQVTLALPTQQVEMVETQHQGQELRARQILETEPKALAVAVAF
jgi:hypothetical protein